MADLVAVGRAVVDHEFRADADGVKYAGSRGGGTAANVALAVAAAGLRAEFVGPVGRDWRGELAVRSLESYGVICDVLRREGRTASFSLVPIGRKARQGSLVGRNYATVAACGWCGRNSRRWLARGSLQELQARDDSRWVFFDSVAGSLGRSVEALGASGQRVALDLSRASLLRFTPSRDLASAVRSAAFVFASQPAAATILRRTGVELDQLCGGLVIVSGGPRGLTWWEKGALGGHIPAPNVAVLDQVGAGDVLVGRTLAALCDANPQETAGTLRDVVTGLGDVLGTRGARGWIAPVGSGILPAGYPLDLVGRAVPKSVDGTCPVCGRPEDEDKKFISASPGRQPGAAVHVSQLRDRALRVLESGAVLQAMRSIGAAENGSAVFIGSGGSFPVADFLSRVYRESTGRLSATLTPHDFWTMPATAELLVLVTHSGRTRDMARALQAYRSVAPEGQVAVITGSARPTVFGEAGPTPADLIVSIPIATSHARLERGFVAIASSVLPCVVATAASRGRELATSSVLEAEDRRAAIASAATRLAERARSAGALHVIHSPWATPAALDLEAKLVESGTGCATLHESKNFSHGRFVSALTTESAPILALFVRPDEYEAMLLRRLEKETSAEVLVFGEEGSAGGLAALYAVQLLSERFAASLDRDISRPVEIPSLGLDLYRW